MAIEPQVAPATAARAAQSEPKIADVRL